MNPPRRGILVPSALLACLAVAALPAAAGDGPAWARRLADQPADARLRVHLDDGAVLTGYPAGVTADSLRLAPRPGAAPAAACALAELTAIERETGAAGRGWTVGHRVGAALGAVTGLLFAALVDAVGEGEEEVSGVDHLAAFVGTGTVGAVGGGALGALVGSLGDTWQPLPLAPPGPRPRQRLALLAGAARADAARGADYSGLHLGLWAPRRLGAWLDAGPEAAWSHLGGTVPVPDGGRVTVGDTWNAGAAARLGPPGPGTAPFASLGVGWYHRDESWLGVSLGLGLRWRAASGRQLDLELRWHDRSTGIDAEPGNGFVTVTAGYAFGI